MNTIDWIEIHNEAVRWFNQYMSHEPFETSVEVIQKHIDNNPQERGAILDKVYSCGVPLSVINQWILTN